MTTQRRKLIASMADKEFRQDYVGEHLHQGFAFQVKANRDARELTQAELGELASMKQSRIHEIEDPSYEGLTLRTAKRIADALDVALLLRLVPYSKFVDFITGTTSIGMRDWMEPIPAFNDDPGLRPALSCDYALADSTLVRDIQSPLLSNGATTSVHGIGRVSDSATITVDTKEKLGAVA